MIPRRSGVFCAKAGAIWPSPPAATAKAESRPKAPRRLNFSKVPGMLVSLFIAAAVAKK
jgi:hypothetical protein